MRQARLREYHHYLVERDGELNWAERTLSRGEPSMQKYETPPKALRNMDPVEFRRQYLAFEAGESLPREMVSLLALHSGSASRIIPWMGGVPELRSERLWLRPWSDVC